MEHRDATGAEITPQKAAVEKVFVDIDPENPVTEIESLCMNCGENGTTRLLLTRIPHFREVVVMAFECPSCHYRNSEVQSASEVQEEGVVYSGQLAAAGAAHNDLNRQVVKGESATVHLPDLRFEIPASTQSGVLTTVEGLLEHAIEGLSAGQEQRQAEDPETYAQLQTVIDRLGTWMRGEQPFQFVLDDPAGNSYVENPRAPEPDPALRIVRYRRTAEQNDALGLAPVDERGADPVSDARAQLAESGEAAQADGELNTVPEVLEFPAVCSSCHAPSTTKMYVMDIPHFKEAVIMSTACDYCGYRSNEVKAGGPISRQGRRITLKVVEAEDLSRDILKSETCGLCVPEVDLELQAGTLGGRFTTVEGLLSQVHDELESRTPFVGGDSAAGERRRAFQKFLDKLDALLKLEVLPFTLILNDPLANSYLQNLYAPDADPNMTIEDYDRTYEQNEVLGLNDMVVEDYNGPAVAARSSKGGSPSGSPPK